MTAGEGTGALAGVRIVEVAGLGPGPFAAMMLADHGAEVVRVLPPRARTGVGAGDGPAEVLARGRRTLTLDLKSEAGRADLLALVAAADGLIEGFRPGVMERLGLGPQACHAVSPRLVYGRMTGWGQDGPLAPRAGHDLNYIALTGVLAAIGPAETPVVPLNLVGDFGGGGMLLAFGMLAGLLSARTTGRGQVVDAAMTDGAALLSAMIHGFRAGGQWPGGRADNLLDGGAFNYGVYRCADGRFVAVGALEPQFLSVLLDGLGIDPASLPDPQLRENWPVCRARLAEVLAGAPRDHWAARFAGRDACLTPVLDWDEAVEDPHNRARGTFIRVGDVVQPAPAPRFSATPAPHPAPPGSAPDTMAGILERWRAAGRAG